MAKDKRAGAKAHAHATAEPISTGTVEGNYGVFEELGGSLVECSTLRLHPLNPRRGSIDEIVESLSSNKQYRPIVVQRSTRTVLAGNHTLQAARRLSWTHIAVDWTDAEGETALAILIADNRTSDLASTDADRLLKTLDAMPNLEGTGYDNAFLHRLRSSQDSKLLFVDPVESNKKGGHTKTRNIDKVGLLQVGRLHLTMEIVDFAAWVKDMTAEKASEQLLWPVLKEEAAPEPVKSLPTKAPPRPEMVVDGTDLELKKLLPFPGSPRKHSVTEICNSLREIGQYRRVVVQAGTNIVVVGGGVVEAAKKLRWSHVRCVVMNLTDDQAKAMHLVDNRTADLAYNDDMTLANALKSISNIVATGYNEKTMRRLLIESGAMDDADIEAPRVFFNVKCAPTQTNWIFPALAAEYEVWQATVMREGGYSDEGVRRVVARRLGIDPALVKGSL